MIKARNDFDKHLSRHTEFVCSFANTSTMISKGRAAISYPQAKKEKKIKNKIENTVLNYYTWGRIRDPLHNFLVLGSTIVQRPRLNTEIEILRIKIFSPNVSPIFLYFLSFNKMFLPKHDDLSCYSN